MTYADITVVPVRSDRKAAYLEFAQRVAAVYREHGATRIVDYWQSGSAAGQDDFHADGTSYEPGELADLASATGASDAESVVVTIMEWPSREARDRGTEAATNDPRIVATMDEDPVFDGGKVLGNTFEVTMDLSDDA